VRPLGRPFKRAIRDPDRDGERQESLRKLVFNNTGTGRIDFDILYDRVLVDYVHSSASQCRLRRE
jgi:hypothetical protein